MGFIRHRVERSEIKGGDHIYTWRTLFTYSHHDIYVGGGKVVHFTPDDNSTISSSTTTRLSPSCPTFSDCGFKRPKSGVVLSCLDCFLKKGSLYLCQYGTSTRAFLAKVRGGTCTTAKSDPPEEVIHRAMQLLRVGFGNHDVIDNNCEEFALYCKTSLLITHRLGGGSSGQASSITGLSLPALLTYPLKWLIPTVGVVTVTTGMYHMNRYGSDIGVRSDVEKVAVEDLRKKLRVCR